VICKAGGAILHEVLAAHIPAVIDYVVPGQEEGNAELLLRHECAACVRSRRSRLVTAPAACWKMAARWPKPCGATWCHSAKTEGRLQGGGSRPANDQRLNLCHPFMRALLFDIGNVLVTFDLQRGISPSRRAQSSFPAGHYRCHHAAEGTF